MALVKRRIADGIGFNYLETEKFKTGFLSVSFIAPLSAETAAKNALIPSVLLRGSVKYPNMAEINKKLDYLYASSLSARNTKRGERQVFGICASMIDSAYTINGEDLLAQVTDFVWEILLNPITVDGAFDPAYTESEKNNLIDAINAKINNKTQYARMRCAAEMCKNERYGLDENGTAKEVSACTAAGVYEQYRYALCHYPIEIFYVGKCDPDDLCDRLGSVFGALDRDPVDVPETEIVREAKTLNRISEDMPVNQGKLAIGFRTGIAMNDPEYPALIMANEIFGGGVTSKLFMNVREKMSLCYYCSSSPESAKGLLFVQSGIETENREIAEKAIFEQLDAVRRGEFTDEELLCARLGIINAYKELSDSAKGLEGWYLGRLLEGCASVPDEVTEAVERVTKEEIVAAANKLTADTVYFLNGTLKGEDENA